MDQRPLWNWRENETEHTRAMITAALNNDFKNVKFKEHPIFKLNMPITCPNVPNEILNPRMTWKIRKL